MVKLKTFRKKYLPQEAIIGLFLVIYEKSSEANIPELNAPLRLLKEKMDKFRAMVHPIKGSELTPAVQAADAERDQYLKGLRSGVDFNARHFDPQRVAAAKAIKVVLRNAVYKQVYRQEFIEQIVTVRQLVRELQTNFAEELTTTGLTEYVQKLAEVNERFNALLQARAEKRVYPYDYKDIQVARTAMEHAYETFRKQLLVLSELAATMGTPDAPLGSGNGATMSYEDLIAQLNDYIAVIKKEYGPGKRKRAATANEEPATNPTNEED